MNLITPEHKAEIKAIIEENGMNPEHCTDLIADYVNRIFEFNNKEGDEKSN